MRDRLERQQRIEQAYALFKDRNKKQNEEMLKIEKEAAER
jgi:hypothetical protein